MIRKKLNQIIKSVLSFILSIKSPRFIVVRFGELVGRLKVLRNIRMMLMLSGHLRTIRALFLVHLLDS